MNWSMFYRQLISLSGGSCIEDSHADEVMVMSKNANLDFYFISIPLREWNSLINTESDLDEVSLFYISL